MSPNYDEIMCFCLGTWETLTFTSFSKFGLLMVMLDDPSLALIAWRTSFSPTSSSCFTFDSSFTINYDRNQNNISSLQDNLINQ